MNHFFILPRDAIPSLVAWCLSVCHTVVRPLYRTDRAGFRRNVYHQSLSVYHTLCHEGIWSISKMKVRPSGILSRNLNLIRFFSYFATARRSSQVYQTKRPHFYSARNARIASAVLATAIPSVRPSVCLSVRLSHAGIVSKRRHVARCSLHRWIAKCV